MLRRMLNPVLKFLSHESAQLSSQPFKRYEASARELGLTRPYLFLSFDCDTDLDAEAAEEVHSVLESLNIKATYAVPGVQLQRSPEPYKKLARRGAEFMNHGALPHTEWCGDQWVGTTFYNTMPTEAVEADIRRGDEIVTEVIGRKPLGFRAPHFGCFQEPEQIELMHRIASELAYQYCSTTLPSYGLKHGPIHKTRGLLEISCFGSARNPETILDSWTYLTNRKQYTLGDQYASLMAETIEFFIRHQMPAIFTWYADPCHVLGQPAFMDSMKLIAASGITSVTGSELAGMANSRL